MQCVEIISDSINAKLSTNSSEKLYLGYGALNLLDDFENKKIVDNHWAEDSSKAKANIVIEKCFDETLQKLAYILNDYHDINYNEQYWKTLLGPWLLSLVTIFIEKYSTSRQLSISEINNSYFCYYPQPANKSIPLDYQDFNSRKMEDEFSHHVFFEVLNYLNVEVRTVEKRMFSEGERDNKNENSLSIVKKALMKYSKKRKVIFSSPYVNRESLIKFFFSSPAKCGMLPGLSCDAILPEMNVSYNNRVDLLSKYLSKVESIDDLIMNYALLYIPVVYLEGFKGAVKWVKSNFPNKVQSINTAVSDITNDLFKIWAAEERNNGAKYIINQHGGLYGIGKFMPLENFQISNSDSFLTWGWSSCNKTKPVGALKVKSRSNQTNKNDKLLIILLSNPKFPYWCTSVPCGSALVDYYNQQIDFYGQLSPSIRSKTVLRFGNSDFEWKFKESFIRKYGVESIQIDDEEYERSILSSRLCLCTYNATTMIECIKLDIPTIMFWDPKLFSIRDEAIDVFEFLNQCGMFQSSVSDASSFINDNYSNITDWWNSEAVIYARNKFVDRYAKDVNLELFKKELF